MRDGKIQRKIGSIIAAQRLEKGSKMEWIGKNPYNKNELL